MAAVPDSALTLPRSAAELPGQDRAAYPVAWDGWADPARREPLADGLRSLLQAAFGLSGDPVVTAPDPATVRLPAGALPDDARAALTAIVGAEGLHDDHATRLAHVGGKSTPDLLDARIGDYACAPDAVVEPATPEAVQAIVERCSALGVAVVPFGGGTSVVGGLRALRRDLRGVIALDLRRLDRLVAVDPDDQTATLQAGLLTPQADALLAPHGVMLGHYPQSYERATIGGYAATRSSGQASSGYGRFDQMVVGVRVATPSGELRLGHRPPNAAGPDLKQLLLGSEGILGVITEVTVRVQPLPQAQRYEGWRLPSFAAGTAALRDLARSGEKPTVMRMSDEVETAMRLATVTEDADDPDATPTLDAQEGSDAGGAGSCLAIVGWDGPDAATVDGRAERAAAILRRHGGQPQGREPGEAWKRGRFDAPFLRDTLLDLGVLVETLETASLWSRLEVLRADLTAALQAALGANGRPVIVMGHVSHVYAEGASLYLTVVAADGAAPEDRGADRARTAIERWAGAKRAAGDAIARHGASISHHHAVGTDHAPWMEDEVGSLGLAVLRAVKQQLDPAGVLNPGKLIDG